MQQCATNIVWCFMKCYSRLAGALFRTSKKPENITWHLTRFFLHTGRSRTIQRKHLRRDWQRTRPGRRWKRRKYQRNLGDWRRTYRRTKWTKQTHGHWPTGHRTQNNSKKLQAPLAPRPLNMTKVTLPHRQKPNRKPKRNQRLLQNTKPIPPQQSKQPIEQQTPKQTATGNTSATQEQLTATKRKLQTNSPKTDLKKTKDTEQATNNTHQTETTVIINGKACVQRNFDFSGASDQGPTTAIIIFRQCNIVVLFFSNTLACFRCFLDPYWVWNHLGILSVAWRRYQLNIWGAENFY